MDAILVKIDADPVVPLIVVVEGTRGGGELIAATLEGTSTRVWRHHWRADSAAILPGFGLFGDPTTRIGRGDLRGLWALLPLSTTTGAEEARQILDEAHGLGLRVAVVTDSNRPIVDADLRSLENADLTLFSTKSELEDALGISLQATFGRSTIGVRFRVACDGCSMLAEIAPHQARGAAADIEKVPPKRIYYWAGLTATQAFNTGIQRVTRALGRAAFECGIEVIPVKWDDRASCIVPLDFGEAAHLERWNGPPARAPDPLPEILLDEWLVVAEVINPAPPSLRIANFVRSRGMRMAAIFYDLIPLKMASIYPPEGLAAFLRYWEIFSEVDVALPISWSVAADLQRYLTGRRLRIPAIVVCPLAGDLPGAERQQSERETDLGDTQLRLIAVGTWEPRKNYTRLLRALMYARRLVPNKTIHLTIVGRRNAGFPDLDAEIRVLAAHAGDVVLLENISDVELLARMRSSDATIFGSWEEGFGLPVLESLWCGLPCLCHSGSAMAEVATGGGTISVDMRDEAAIVGGIVRLASESGLIARLRREAVARPIRGWDEYARDVLAALTQTVTPLPPISQTAVEHSYEQNTDLMALETAVLWSYRLLLGREPENSSIIKKHAEACVSIADVRTMFLNSDEFLRSVKSTTTKPASF